MFRTTFALAITLAWFLAVRTASAAPIKVACIGEHTTHSHSFPATNRESQPVGQQEYPAMLQTMLGQGYQVRNFGDCCATVMQGYPGGAETHPYVNGSNAGDGPGYNESIAFLPDIVVIGSWGRQDWGMNKAPGQVFTVDAFTKGFDDLISRYQKLASHPKIFISFPVPIPFGQADMPDEGVKTSDLLPVFKSIAAKYALPAIDLYSKFLNRKDLFKQPPDEKGEGEHLNDAGLKVIAEAVYEAMTANVAAPDGGADASSPTPDASSTVDASGPSPMEPPEASAGSGGNGGDAVSQPSGSAGERAGSAEPTSEQAAGAPISTKSSDSGCSCSLLHGPARSTLALSGLPTALLLASRRRRRRRKPAAE